MKTASAIRAGLYDQDKQAPDQSDYRASCKVARQIRASPIRQKRLECFKAGHDQKEQELNTAKRQATCHIAQPWIVALTERSQRMTLVRHRAWA